MASSISASKHIHSSRNDILSDHDRAQWGRVRRRQNNGIHKNFIKTHEAKWPLNFLGSRYDSFGQGQQQL
jgi:hypothetical protein